MVVSVSDRPPRGDQRSEHERRHVAGVLRRIGAFVPGHDDDTVAAEGRRGLDTRYLAREEAVEVTDGVAAARVMAVLAVVRNDEVEVADGAVGQCGVESAGVLRAGPPIGRLFAAQEARSPVKYNAGL